MVRKKIIFDTDIGGDCDDAAALAIALELHNAGECELLGVTVSHSCQASGGCVEAILKYYGHPEIPVGCLAPEESIPWEQVYAEETAHMADTRYVRGELYENTVRLLRRLLAGSPEKVTIVATGSMTSLARLLASGPDEYSPLSGVELVREKVELGACMAGRFFEAWPEPIILGNGFVVREEWNAKADVPATKLLCEQWPGRLIFCSYEIGLRMITCKNLQKFGPADNPVRRCYEIWHKNDSFAGREGWDGATMLYAIRPDAGYWNLYPWGKFLVDEKGGTAWQEDPEGKQTFLTDRLPVKEVENIIEEILDRDIRRHAG